MQQTRKHQHGIALVSTLVTVAIIVGLSASLVYQQHIGVRRTGQLLHGDQAIMYLLAAESFIKVLLNLDAQQNDYDYYSENEPWRQKIENSYDGGQLETTLIDLDGRFNVNNLRRSPTEEEINSGKQDVNLISSWQSCYRSIVQASASESAPNDIDVMVDSLADWLDEDVIERPLGAEDNYYSSVSDLQGNYKTGNTLLTDEGELALIRGYEDIFDSSENSQGASNFLRNIATLPISNQKVNINTATATVLICLDEKKRLTDEIAERIITRRQEEPFEKITEFYALLDQEYPVKEEQTDAQGKEKKNNSIPWKDIIPESKVQVSSNFFMMKTQLAFGIANITAYTTLQRTHDGGVRVIRRVIDAL